MRFHAALRPRASLIEPFIDPGWSDRGALIGVLAEGASELVVALGRYDRLRDSSAAGVAFAVADDFQGHGIATRLLEQLADEAAPRGIDRLIFEILPNNARMLAVVA